MHTTKPTPVGLWLSMMGIVMDHKWYFAERFEQKLPVPYSRYRALRRVEQQPRSQRELAAAMGVDAPAMTVIVNDLVKHGLATREPHPDDGRVKLVTATAAGLAWLDDVRSLEDGAPPLMDVLTRDERRELARLLDKLQAGQAGGLS
ncbi:MarR family winged helix-turn-helix transcriptional regulator [Luteipulveratus halotolerans]|uniref:HTH marR-type domain-containing protein n=1 Tax=Luteipulveratus halotolerans TaxID=1631356 RepID=A0A0L6CLY4_9MICO|nr:MarR family transcriptional regulator [Luteipulveratus halotolerans]KNX38645.1 hypothetical protein VV01_18260 [Luteipulveratus halotolerans]